MTNTDKDGRVSWPINSLPGAKWTSGLVLGDAPEYGFVMVREDDGTVWRLRSERLHRHRKG